jgi:hypothetical protein
MIPTFPQISTEYGLCRVLSANGRRSVAACKPKGLHEKNLRNPGRDGVAVDFGVTMLWSQKFATFLAYHGDLGRQDYIAHNISGGVNVSF